MPQEFGVTCEVFDSMIKITHNPVNLSSKHEEIVALTKLFCPFSSAPTKSQSGSKPNQSFDNDGADKVFYKFITDNPEDLTSGTLYAAKATQDATTDPAVTGFNIEWIQMAHATNAQVEAWISEYDGIDESDFIFKSLRIFRRVVGA